MKQVKSIIIHLIAIVFILSLSIVSIANDSYLGHAPDRGVIISISSPKSLVYKNGDTVTIEGRIKLIGKKSDSKVSLKDNGKDNGKDGLLEEFNKQGIDISASFPSDNFDITSKISFSSVSESEIKFTYVTQAISENDLNQFSLKVYNNPKDKELLKKLSIIKAKLDKRLSALTNLKNNSIKNKSSEDVIKYIQSEIDKLNKINNKIADKVNSDDNLMAENTYALQVGNNLSNQSVISTVMNKYRFVIESEVGTVIQGMTTHVKAQIINLRKSGDSDEDSDEDDQKIADFIFNSKYLFTTSPQKLGGGQVINYEYTTAGLLPSDSNVFSVVLYKYEESKRGKRIGYLSQVIPVAQDLIAPKWASDSIPNNNEQYFQVPPNINLKVSDEFGRINPESLQVSLSGTPKDNSFYNQDLSLKFTKTTLDYGKSFEFNAVIDPLQEGEYDFTAQVKDLAGNSSLPNPYLVKFWIDKTPPKITLPADTNFLTNNKFFELPVIVSDLSPTWTDIYVNNQLYFSTQSTNFAASAILNIEGQNEIKVVSTDLAGNSSSSSISVVLDTTPPVLSDLVPINNSLVYRVQFPISGKSNEALLSIKVNNLNLTLSTDKKSFSGTYVSSIEGVQPLVWTATDIAGNQTEISTSIDLKPKMLISELITIVPDRDNAHLYIIGKHSAARPNINITASEGLLSFNTGSTVASSDGSFRIRLGLFQSVKLVGTDPVVGDSESLILSFDSTTKLSGIVKDINDSPLSNATVSILGSNLSTKTNSLGVFNFDNVISGDQTLVVDGSTVYQASTGSNRIFSSTSIVVNIGIGQNNVISRPIYMTPNILDGSQTPVIANESTTVTSPYAPGVTLEVSANSAQFPPNVGNSINIMTIPSDKSTVAAPAAAIPTNVISLEPSGLKFTERADLTLPNDNELPVGVELVIFSMNSSKGIWEIDGVAKVTDDGQSIQTKPGLGISHFSLVYAVPLKPQISEMSNPNILGVDTTQGAMSLSIDLPEYKSLGQSIKPKMVYKSSWAKPSAVISNLFDIPEMKTVAEATNTYFTIHEDCKDIICNKYLVKDERTLTQRVTSWYVPDKIRSQFFVSNIASDQVEFVDTIDVPENRDEVLSGVGFLNSTNTAISESAGIPNRSVISYGVSLKDNSTNEYLKTGIYPTLARYEIRLKNLTLTTMSFRQTLRGDVNETYESYDEQKSISALKEALPQDVSSNVIVQNKINSPFGSGWQFVSNQKILNPSSNQIVIEEEGGDLTTYSINDSIQTLYDGTNKGVDLAGPVDVSQWPYALLKNENQQVGELDLSSSSPQFISKGVIPRSSGILGNHTYWTCPGTHFTNNPGNYWFYTPPSGQIYDVGDGAIYPRHNYFSVYTHTYSVKPDLGGIVRDPSGKIYFSNKKEHSLFLNQGNYTIKMAGSTDFVETAIGQTSGINIPVGDMMNQFCQNTFGENCGQEQYYTTSPCLYNFERNCVEKAPTGTVPYYNYTGYVGDVTPNPFINLRYNCDVKFKPAKFVNSTGNIGVARNSGDDVSNAIISQAGSIGFNNPGQMAFTSDGNLLIVDTGNNAVRKINLSTNTISKVAGNGQNTDLGDGGAAVYASLYHPKGVTVDSGKNIYISTEKGYIRKVDIYGNISTIAGLPIELGGMPKNEGAANTIPLINPTGLAIDSDNNYLYVADTGNHRVLRIDLTTGYAKTIAGSGNCTGITGDGGAALNASLCAPTYLGLDQNKNLTIVESGRNRIRKVIFNTTAQSSSIYLSSNNDLSKLQKNVDNTWLRTYRNGDRVTFNPSGLQTSYVDRIGNTTTYDYDSDSKLVRVTDPTTQVLTLNYSGSKVSNIEDPAGRKTYFDYSGNFLTKITYPDGNSKKFTYNPDGLLLKETNERGLSKEYSYNEYNRLSQIKNPDDTTTKLDDFGSKTVNQPQLQTYGTGDNQAHDTITDGKNLQYKVSHDFNGFVKTIKNPKDEETQIFRNEFGLIDYMIHPDNSIETFTYDPNTRDVLVHEDQNTGIKEETTYNSFGQVVTKKDGRGFTYINNYDPSNGLLMESVAPGNRVTQYSYYPNGLVKTKTVFPVNSNSPLTTAYEYDSKGNQTKVINPDGKFTSFTYDLAGNVSSVTSNKDNGTPVTKYYTYDYMNRLQNVKSEKNEITTYTYLPTGELALIQDPTQKETTFDYNVMGQLVKKTEPEGTSYQFAYDENGNKIQEIDPKNQVKAYTYDSQNRLMIATLPDDQIGYDYDLRGRVITIQNKNALVEFGNDSGGRKVFERISGLGALSTYPAQAIGYGYDQNSNLTDITTLNGNLHYNFDELNRLTSLTNYKNESFSFAYDDASRLVQMSRPGTTTSYSYNTGSILSGIYHKSGSVVRSYFEYSYDQRNYPIQKRSTASTTNYAYDDNGQLTSAGTETYSYDSNGNRISDLAGSYTYDQANQKLLEDYDYTYQYDNNGNLITKLPKDINKEAYRYEYSSTNQLVRFRKFSSPTGPVVKEATYAYDGLGRRIEKKVIDNQDSSKSMIRRYVYSGENILFEYDGSSVLLAKYTHSNLKSDDVLSVDITTAGVQAKMSTTAGSYMYLKDHLGSVTDITDAGGNVVQKYDYSSFGKINSIKDGSGTDITASPIINTSYTYTGREIDEESGLYYYRARYYDSSIGRFLQKDPDPGKVMNPITVNNKYSYVGNNPIMNTDPSGKWFLALIAAMAISGGIAGGIYAAVAPGATLSSVVTGILLGTASGAFTGLGAGLGIIAGGAAIGTAAATLWGGLGAGLAGGIVGALSNPSNPAVGFMTGFVFGFIGGAIGGAGKLPFFADLTQGTILNAPPIDSQVPHVTPSAPSPVNPGPPSPLRPSPPVPLPSQPPILMPRSG